ncbi:MAG TPA: hypothetical protein VFA56_05690 [Gaiellaceae bacterium]|nr:hypothetical protein [Gaiellaceae bacterium]
METAVAGRPRTGFARWAALAGAVYVVLFVVGSIVLFSGAKGGDDPPAVVRAWYSDSGHRDRLHIGWILVGLSIFFLLWFVAALRRTVGAGDRDGILTTMVGLGGGVYAAAALVAVSLEEGIKTMSDDTYRHQVFPELIHAADDAGWVIHASGAVGLSVMIVSASYAFMARGTWPRWAGWVGIVIGILSLAAVAFFPQFLFLLWILVVSILMFLRPQRYEPVTTAI